MILHLLAAVGALTLVIALLVWVYAKGFTEGAKCQEEIEEKRKRFNEEHGI